MCIAAQCPTDILRSRMLQIVKVPDINCQIVVITLNIAKELINQLVRILWYDTPHFKGNMLS